MCKIIDLQDIGQNVFIDENVIIKKDVKIGNNVIIHPNVIIEAGTVIGNNVEIFPGVYIGRTPKGAGATTRIPTFNKKIVIGDNCSIGSNAIIYYDVNIGNNTLIGDGASIREQVKIGSFCIISRYVTINYNTIIGDETKIMDLSHITGNCKIGKNVFISVHVSTTNDNNLGKQGYDESIIVGPIIKDNVRIGAKANILPGTTIGENVLVAAGSVVTKDIPNGKMIAGCPARIIGDIS